MTKKKPSKKPTKTKARSKKKSGRSSGSAAKEPHSPQPSMLSGIVARRQRGQPVRGTGSAAAGQAGALQGLPREADVDSESVEELVEEGQAWEANIISGVEHAKDPDREEVHVHESLRESSEEEPDED